MWSRKMVSKNGLEKMVSKKWSQKNKTAVETKQKLEPVLDILCNGQCVRSTGSNFSYVQILVKNRFLVKMKTGLNRDRRRLVRGTR